MLIMLSSTMADDSFSVDNVSLPQNREAEVVVRFSFDAESTCSGYSFWLQIPNQLAFVTNAAGTKVEFMAGDCYTEPPTITPNLSEGYLKVACLNANSDPLNKQMGTLVSFKLKVKDGATVTTGDVLNAHLTNAQISAENGSVHNVANVDFTITITEPGDTRTVLDETSTTPPSDATGVDVRVRRTIKANEWSTIVLPFAMSNEQLKAAFGDDVQLSDFIGVDTEFDDDDNVKGIKVHFADVTELEANHPYIIKTSNAIDEFTVDGVDISVDEAYVEYDNGKTGSRRVVYSGFYGTYRAQTMLDKNTLFLNNNKFWYSAGNTKMKAFRAYFEFLDVLPDIEDSNVKVFYVIDSSATGVEAVNSDNASVHGVYTIEGMFLGNNVDIHSLPKGMYIVDGKKIIIK